MNKKVKQVGIAHRIEQMLEETRVITPGTQAILGFQLAAVFQNSFETLADNLKVVHFYSLVCILLSVVFLILTPAFHRIVEKGHDTERFHTIASIFMLVAMFFLALGISLDLYVVSGVIFKDEFTSKLIASLTFISLFLCWFGINLFIHKKEN